MRGYTAAAIKELMRSHKIESGSIHGPFSCNGVAQYYFRKHLREHKVKGLMEDAFWYFQGTFEASPAFKIADERNMWYVTHAGVIAELEQTNDLWRFHGRKVRVENGDNFAYPGAPNGREGLDAAIWAYDLLGTFGAEVQITYDIEHALKEAIYDGRWKPSNEGILDPSKVIKADIERIGDRVIGEMHICDFEPSGTDIKGGGHRAAGKGRLDFDKVFEIFGVGTDREPLIVIEAPGEAAHVLATFMSGGTVFVNECHDAAQSFVDIYDAYLGID
jgi:sugar phosphate isomerase/epimerase